MKTNLKYSILLFSFIMSCAKLNSQNSDPCGCNEALKSNTDKVYTEEKNYKFNEALDILFKEDYTYWESGEWKKNSSTDVGLDLFGVFSALFGNDESSYERKDKFNDMRKYYNKNKRLEISDYQYLSQKSKDKTPYTAWLSCKKSCIEDNVLVERVVNGDEVVVTVTWTHRNTTDFQRITGIVTSNCEAEYGGDLYRGTKIAGKSSYTAKYKIDDINKDASITINVSEYGSYTVLVPAQKKQTEEDKSKESCSLPVGSIISFAGMTEPEGSCWLLCDGKSLNSADYPLLHKAIGTSWGKPGVEAGVFNLPDLRGMFLRGMLENAPIGNDPDVEARLPRMPGGASKNNVGSYQSDEVGKHTHSTNVISKAGNTDPKSGIPQAQSGEVPQNPGKIWFISNTGDDTGNQTTPKNVYVRFYVKYK